MTKADPNYAIPPEERLFAPEDLRPLDEFPRPLAEPLREHHDLQYHLTAIRKHFLELREEATERLTPALDGVAIGSPDHMDKIEGWRAAIHRGEVPAAFGKVKLLQARQMLADHFYYGEILGLVQLTLERGLWRALPRVGRVPLEWEEVTRSSPPVDREETVEMKPEDARQLLALGETAVAMRRSLPDLLGALQLLLGLLTNVNLADLIRGKATVTHARSAGSTPKYARGIQAATSHVYRAGMSEQACWEALGRAEDETFTVEGTDYEFRLDRRGAEIVTAWQIDDRTGRERSVKRASFHRYFTRARETPTTT